MGECLRVGPAFRLGCRLLRVLGAGRLSRRWMGWKGRVRGCCRRFCGGSIRLCRGIRGSSQPHRDLRPGGLFFGAGLWEGEVSYGAFLGVG